MSLDQIICYLNYNNINNLFLLLQNSKCGRAKHFLTLLIKGDDFYHSLAKFYDSIGYQILLMRNLNAIILLGKYIKIKSKFQKQTLYLSIYPITLLVIQVLAIFGLSSIVKISYLLIIILTFINLLTVIFIYMYLLRQYKNIIILHLFLSFVNQELSIEKLISCYYYLAGKRLNILAPANLEELCKLYCNIDFISITHLQDNIEYVECSLRSLVNRIPKLFVGLITINTATLCMYLIYSYSSIISIELSNSLLSIK